MDFADYDFSSCEHMTYESNVSPGVAWGPSVSDSFRVFVKNADF